VKSCHRVDVDRAVVGALGGFVGDREWQLVRPDGELVTQRQEPGLARIHPELADGGLRLHADGVRSLDVARPSGPVIESDSGLGGIVRLADAGDEAAAWFRSVLGSDVRLAAIGDDYRRRLPGDRRAVPDLEVAVGDAIEELFGGDVSLADVTPVLVATTASVEFLVDRASEPFDLTRFRPNVVVEGTAPWAEDRWRTFAAGGATFRGAFPMPRCAVPQVDQETGERHREPAKVLRAHRFFVAAEGDGALRTILSGNALFGAGFRAGPVGASVCVGDPVIVTEEGEPVAEPVPVPLAE
jgi:uncharacterized protein YcbX